MFSPPTCSMWLAALLSGAVALYYGAIVSGLFKDSLMAQFRRYGDERRPAPLVRFLLAAGLCCFALASVLGVLMDTRSFVRTVFPPLLLLLLTLICWGGAALVTQDEGLRESLPRWYFTLLRTTSRQERRHIGYAWLRIPFRLRWRLNADQASFVVWVDLVRLTVHYGAYDPDSPWNKWQ